MQELVSPTQGRRRKDTNSVNGNTSSPLYVDNAPYYTARDIYFFHSANLFPSKKDISQDNRCVNHVTHTLDLNAK